METVDFSPMQMLRTKSFKFIFLTYFLSMVAGMMSIGHIVPFIGDAGYNPMQAAFSITILSVFNGTGRVVCGALSDRAGTKKTLTWLFVIIGGAMAALHFIPYLPLLYTASAVIGFCFGGFLSVYPAMTCDYFGLEYFGINYGMVFTGYGLGCFAGPWLGGLIHDKTGSYLAAFISAGILAVAGGVLTLLTLKRPVHPSTGKDMIQKS